VPVVTNTCDDWLHFAQHAPAAPQPGFAPFEANILQSSESPKIWALLHSDHGSGTDRVTCSEPLIPPA
jgi:hypothetical protein